MRAVKASWSPPGAVTPAIVAFAAGLVAPLALPIATTWEQRAALGILLAAATAWLARARQTSTAGAGPAVAGVPGSAAEGVRGAGASSVAGAGATGASVSRSPLVARETAERRAGHGSWRPAALAGGIAVLAVVATAPAAMASERVARAEMAGRAGARLLELGEPARAAERYEEARRLGSTDPTVAPALAEAHWRIAESAVAGGLSANSYAAAADHLAAALEADPPRQDAARLAEAVAAVRMADQIWNQYDWPRTIAELRKAQSLRPDLPGVAQKLADAEASQAAATRR